jgi:hypothetical protein
VSPDSGVAFATSSGINGGTLLLAHGTGGYVMFQDANGDGIGWHIKHYAGWSINGVQGSLVMEIDLEAPFWLGDPPASVSPALIHMKNAGSAKWLLQLQTPRHHLHRPVQRRDKV